MKPRTAPRTVLYRGPLSSCNYGCEYCPFAKRKESKAELAVDRAALERFVAWAVDRGDPTQVFFTPWGEALIRRWYREAFVALSRAASIERVCAQTNLSWPQAWLDRCDLSRVALWCTFHPGEVSIERFVARCKGLDARGVRYSVGVVALREHYEAALRLRDLLSPSVYLWANAYRREQGYYTQRQVEAWEGIDPLFSLNLREYSSLGRACRAGSDAITVDGDGTARRCHFIDSPIGNIYDPDFARALIDAPCTRATCRCHIGYVHMDELGLYDVFEGGLLERIPRAWPEREALLLEGRRRRGGRSLHVIS
jgi:MoaA/NifB/PqqE/SkfB family radical SAM enzyme